MGTNVLVVDNELREMQYVGLLELYNAATNVSKGRTQQQLVSKEAPWLFFLFCRVCSTAATRERVEDIQGQQNTQTHSHNREEEKLLMDGANEPLFKCVIFQDFLFKVMLIAYI